MKKTYSALVVAAFLLAGCVNVHVHFPSAPPVAGDTKTPDETKKP
jgi:PBP1b-binding outer membrane lipoprotein LpoB